MAISGTLSFGSASAAFDPRRPGVLMLYRGTAAFSSATLAMDQNRNYWCGRRAGDRFPHRGVCDAGEGTRFSPDCSADRCADERERSYLCLGKFPATLQRSEERRVGKGERW